MTSKYRIRTAERSDIDVLVAFTLQEAHQAERRELDIDSATRGVRRAFEESAPATYYVAESQAGGVVASTSVVTEWSNFHGGHYWWVQSLFIIPEHRGSGLIELLLEHVTAAAGLAGALDLRLYAHSSNQRALRAYRRCGFTVAPYIVMRRDVPTRPPLQPTNGTETTT